MTSHGVMLHQHHITISAQQAHALWMFGEND
jgi:hypothetical protein